MVNGTIQLDQIENLFLLKPLVNMIQEQLEKEDYLMNSPFLKKVKSEGREERSYEIAKNMRKEGVDVEQIARFTGLSVEEIEQLQN